MTRIAMSNLQTQALVDLLVNTNSTSESIDIKQDKHTTPIDVTIWKRGEHETWQIGLAGNAHKEGDL